MKRFPLTLPVEGSIYPFKIDGHCELHAVDRIDLGQGLMYLRALATPHKERPTFINDVVRMMRPNDAAAWLPVLRDHYEMDALERAALIAEAKENPYSSVTKNQQWLADFTAMESGPYEVMGPVCHNGEDLARAFPQAPSGDLSRDLYATIGDSVPPLVWPRQETPQCPTRGEAESAEPGIVGPMKVSDFAVGDRITVVAKVEILSNGCDAGWECAFMDETVGALGLVDDASDDRVLVRLDSGDEWYYAPEALALENACSEVPKAPVNHALACTLAALDRQVGESAKEAAAAAEENTPHRPHVFKVGEHVTVARKVERDTAGQWCFWPKFYDVLGQSGVAVALAEPRVGAYVCVDLGDAGHHYLSPEALDPVAEVEAS